MVIQKGALNVPDNGEYKVIYPETSSDQVLDEVRNKKISEVLNDFYTEALIRGVVIKSLAKGDGVTNDTQAIADALLLSNTYIFDDSTYLVDTIVFPDNSIIFFNDTKFNRTSTPSGVFIKTGSNSVIYGKVEINGNKTPAGTKSNVGIDIQDGTVVNGVIESSNNAGHGIQLRNNTKANILIAYDNGNNPGPSGTGDGVYMSNANNVTIEIVKVFNNSRTGLVMTTYDSETSGENPQLSKFINIGSVESYGNAYNQNNAEAVSYVTINQFVRGGIYTSKSLNCTYRNIQDGNVYGIDTKNITLENVEIKPTGATSNIFYLSGENPVVKKVIIRDTADSYSSNAFEVVDSVKSNAVVEDVLVERALNGIRIQGGSFVKNTVTLTATNRYVTYDDVILTLANIGASKIESGIKFLYRANNNVPTTGSFKEGDKIYTTKPILGGYEGIICISAGTPGTWRGFGKIENIS